MARAIFAVGHMLPAFALLITAAGVGLLLEDHPPHIAAWLACVGIGIYLLGTRVFLVADETERQTPGCVSLPNGEGAGGSAAGAACSFAARSAK